MCIRDSLMCGHLWIEFQLPHVLVIGEKRLLEVGINVQHPVEKIGVAILVFGLSHPSNGFRCILSNPFPIIDDDFVEGLNVIPQG